MPIILFFFFNQWQTGRRNLRKIKFQDQLMNPQFGAAGTLYWNIQVDLDVIMEHHTPSSSPYPKFKL